MASRHPPSVLREKERLIKSARAIRARFFATTRRGFAGIIVFISRKPNEAVAKKIREVPQAIHSEVPKERKEASLWQEAKARPWTEKS